MCETGFLARVRATLISCKCKLPLPAESSKKMLVGFKQAKYILEEIQIPDWIQLQ